MASTLAPKSAEPNALASGVSLANGDSPPEASAYGSQRRCHWALACAQHIRLQHRKKLDEVFKHDG